MFEQAYYINNQPQPVKFSGLFDNIIQGINTGLNVFNATLQSGLLGGGAGGSGGGCSTPAKGLTCITQAVNTVLSQLDQLAAQVGQQPYQQIVDAANQLAGVLSNSQYVYQAKSGKDAAALAKGKTDAQTKARMIVEAAGQVSGITAAGNQAGQVITSGGNVLSTGADTASSLIESLLYDKTLIYAGIGLAGLYFVFGKKK